MFKRRTLFIVGAGASQEAGFPVGATLDSRIVTDNELNAGSIFNNANFQIFDAFFALEAEFQ